MGVIAAAAAAATPSLSSFSSSPSSCSSASASLTLSSSSLATRARVARKASKRLRTAEGERGRSARLAGEVAMRSPEGMGTTVGMMRHSGSGDRGRGGIVQVGVMVLVTLVTVLVQRSDLRVMTLVEVVDCGLGVTVNVTCHRHLLASSFVRSHACREDVPFWWIQRWSQFRCWAQTWSP